MPNRLTHLSTDELLSIVSKPDESKDFSIAVAELILRHKSVVFDAAMRVCGRDRSRADDVFQDTFLRLFQWLKSRSGTAPLHSFPRLLRVFAKRAAVDMQRRSRDESMPEAEIEAATQDLEQRVYVRELIDQLDRRSGQVLQMAFFEGMGSCEIAKRLDLTPSNVRVIKHRAIHEIRQFHQIDDSLDKYEIL